MKQKPKAQQHDEKPLMLFENYLRTTQPVIRDHKGKLMHKNWTLEQIMFYIQFYPECMQKLVYKYPQTLQNIGADIFHQELGAHSYQTLVNYLQQEDLELAVEFAKHLPAKSSLFKEIAEKAIKQDKDITPLIDAMYWNCPELYRCFTERQKTNPTLTGLKTMLKFFPELIPNSADKQAKRLEFCRWLDVLKKYLRNHPRETDFLLTGYQRFKAKGEGASAYLLKEVILQFAPNLLEPKIPSHCGYFL